MAHIYNGILLSHKKNEIMPFAATWMDLEIIIPSEFSQKGKDKYHMISLICGIENMTQMNLFMKRNRITEIENRLVAAKGEGAGRGSGSGRLGLADVSYYL